MKGIQIDFNIALSETDMACRKLMPALDNAFLQRYEHRPPGDRPLKPTSQPSPQSTQIREAESIDVPGQNFLGFQKHIAPQISQR